MSKKRDAMKNQMTQHSFIFGNKIDRGKYTLAQRDVKLKTLLDKKQPGHGPGGERRRRGRSCGPGQGHAARRRRWRRRMAAGARVRFLTQGWQATGFFTAEWQTSENVINGYSKFGGKNGTWICHELFLIMCVLSCLVCLAFAFAWNGFFQIGFPLSENAPLRGGWCLNRQLRRPPRKVVEGQSLTHPLGGRSTVWWKWINFWGFVLFIWCLRTCWRNESSICSFKLGNKPKLNPYNSLYSITQPNMFKLQI